MDWDFYLLDQIKWELFQFTEQTDIHVQTITENTQQIFISKYISKQTFVTLPFLFLITTHKHAHACMHTRTDACNSLDYSDS